MTDDALLEFVLPTFGLPDDAIEDWDESETVRTLRRAQYALVDGFRPLELDLVVPASATPVPVVVWIHGGGFRFGTNRDTKGPVPSAAIRTALLDRGIAVASVQYRLTAEAVFPACFQDVVAAVRWLRRFAVDLGIDADRVGAWGESAGGFLTAMLGANITDPALLGSEGVGDGRADVQVVVPWYPPTDLLTLGADALIPGVPMDHDAADSPESLLLGGAVQEVPERAKAASPTTYASPASAPTLLVHGAGDVVVSPRQSERLADALRAAGAEVELVLVPEANHVFGGTDPALQIPRSVEFLARYLLP